MVQVSVSCIVLLCEKWFYVLVLYRKVSGQWAQKPTKIPECKIAIPRSGWSGWVSSSQRSRNSRGLVAACLLGLARPESPNAEKAAQAACSRRRWCRALLVGAVIRRLLLLQTRKTLHHKGVWLAPTSSFPGRAPRLTGRARSAAFPPPWPWSGDWRRGGISGPDSRLSGNRGSSLR